jgi:hypothetical protein
MRLLLRILAAILALALLVGLGYLAYRVAMRYWLDLLIWGYIIGAAITFILGIVGVAVMNMPRLLMQKSDVMALTAAFRQQQPGWKRLRHYFQSLFSTVATALAWPCIFTTAVVNRLAKDKRTAASPRHEHHARALRQGMSARDLLAAGTLALLVALLFFTRIASSPDSRVQLLTLLLTGAPIAHTAALAISPSQAAESFRRRRLHPLLVFAMHSILSLFVLVVGCTLVVHWQDLDEGWTDKLWSTSKQLFGFNAVRHSLLNNQSVATHNIVLSCIGLLYYIAFIRSLLAGAVFRRTTDDMVAMAMMNMVSGDFARAMNWVDQVPQDASTPASLSVRAGCLMALDKPAQALDAIARSITKERGRPAAEREQFLCLSGLVILTPCPPRVLANMLRLWLQRTSDDAFAAEFYRTAMLMCQNEDSSALTEVAALAAQQRPVSMLQAWHLAFNNLHNESVAMVRSFAYLDAPSEFVRRCDEMMLTICNPATSPREDSIAFGKWIDTNLDWLISTILGCEDNQLQSTMFVKLQTLYSMSITLSPEHLQRLEFEINSLRRDLDGRANRQSILAMNAMSNLVGGAPRPE